MPRGNQATELLAFFHRIGDTRHHHVANNNLNLATRQLITKRQNACGIATGQLFMLDGIGMLNVEQHHIGLVEHSIELLGVVGVKRISAAVKAGMHAAIGVVVHCTEQVGQKLGLQKRLATRNRNAAATVKLMVTLELVHKVLDGHHRAAVNGPGIGIVAIRAAHGTALDKHYEADAGTVDRTHRLDRMYAAQSKRGVLGTSVHTLERHLSHSRYLASLWF